MREIQINNDAIHIITNRLREHGYRSWLVGGALRDLIIGLEPKDWDMSTDATPDQIRGVFPDAIPVGERFGCVQIELPGLEPVQLTTLRAEVDYIGRHPTTVEFTKDVMVDLSHRDFTFNAMALPLDGNESSLDGLIDPFGGVDDLFDHRLRAVGDPGERFREDPLRMLRAIRMAQHTESNMDSDVWDAIREMSHRLSDVSLERIRQEIEGILVPRNVGATVPCYIVMMRSLGLLKHIFPALDATFGVDQNPRWHKYDVFTHTTVALSHSPEDLRVRLAILYHDVGKPLVRTIGENGSVRFYGHEKESARLAQEDLSRLIFPGKLVKDVVKLVEEHTLSQNMSDSGIRRLYMRLDQRDDLLEDLLILRSCDIKAGRRNPDIRGFDRFSDRIFKVVHDLKTRSHRAGFQLAINGLDIMVELGIPAGPKVGQIKQHLLGFVMEDPRRNTRDQLLKELNNFTREISVDAQSEVDFYA